MRTITIDNAILGTTISRQGNTIVVDGKRLPSLRLHCAHALRGPFAPAYRRECRWQPGGVHQAIAMVLAACTAGIC